MANKNLFKNGTGSPILSSPVLFDPPAIVRPARQGQASSIAECQSRIRGMHSGLVQMTVERANDIGDELNRLKNLCVAENKEFHPEVEQCDLSIRNAQRYMQVNNNWPLLESHMRQICRMSIHDALKWASEAYCPDCRAGGPKKNCKACKSLRSKAREAGEDDLEPHERVIEAAKKFWKKRLEELANLKAAPPDTIANAFKHLEGLVVCFRKAAESPDKPAMEPKNVKCKFCGESVVLGQTAKMKTATFQLHDAGDFAVRENKFVYVRVGEMVDHETLYHLHHPRCPARRGKK